MVHSSQTLKRTVQCVKNGIYEPRPYEGLSIWFNYNVGHWEVIHSELDLLICGYLPTKEAAITVLRAIETVEHETDHFWLMLCASPDYLCTEE